ncbi:MAG TPA: hypothetical protein DGG95_10130, partial [Cytophagales bacterium]|nr:hypothetical protein [Cytophagales bacterium]
MAFNLNYRVSLAILLIAFHFSFTENVSAQTHEPRFKLVQGADGITFGKINEMVRDSEGMMWLIDQKNGLLRYDGTHVTVFAHDAQNPNSLGGLQPEDMQIDSNGIFWISFWGTGLDRFDPKTKEFKHFRYDKDDPSSISNDTVSAVLVDHLGNVWAGTSSGLDLLDQQTNKFKHYRHDPKDPKSLIYNFVRSVYEDREGTLWIGTGMAWDTHQKGGLNKFNRASDNFTIYQHDPKDPNSLINNKVRALFEDSHGNFWVGTSGDGLHSLDRKTGKFTRYLNDPKNPNKLSRPPLTSAYFDHITFITEDFEGQLWIGTWSNGVNRYNPATNEITYFGNQKNGLNESNCWIAKSFEKGLFWMSSDPIGLFQIDLYTNNIPYVAVDGSGGIHQFYQSDSQSLWLCTDGGGLMKKNLTSGQLQVFKNNPANPQSVSNDIVGVMMKDRKGNLWVGTNDGLNQFDPVKGTFTRYMHDEKDKESIVNSRIIDIRDDSEGNLWIGTFNGLDKLNTTTGKFTHYVHTQDTSSLSDNLIVGILEEKPGELWVSAWAGGGLHRLNTATGKFKHYLKGQWVGKLVRDHSGVIWVSTANGLFRYVRERDLFVPISNNNLSLANEEIRVLFEDDADNLWAATPTGIIKINKDRNQFTRYGRENGIDKLVWYLSSFKTLDGQLLFGTNGGYYSFYPSKLKTTPLAPTISLTDFWIGNESLSASTNQQGWIYNDTKEIQLSYNQDIFSIGFSTTDYSQSDYKRTIYSLEGYDLNWRQPGSESRAYYFNVPPGKYTFTVKAMNGNNGEWRQKQFSIIISPPWWRTWWAYGGFGFIFIGFVFSADRYQRKRLFAKAQAEAKEKELAQAKEIEKAYNELKATQSQLVQSEKMASLGELTAGIAHEIQNPLNFVNNFS